MKRGLDKKLDDLIWILAGILEILTVGLLLIATGVFWIWLAVWMRLGGAQALNCTPLWIEVICVMIFILIMFIIYEHGLLKEYMPQDEEENTEGEGDGNK